MSNRFKSYLFHTNTFQHFAAAHMVLYCQNTSQKSRNDELNSFDVESFFWRIIFALIWCCVRKWVNKWSYHLRVGLPGASSQKGYTFVLEQNRSCRVVLFHFMLYNDNKKHVESTYLMYTTFQESLPG